MLLKLFVCDFSYFCKSDLTTKIINYPAGSLKALLTHFEDVQKTFCNFEMFCNTCNKTSIKIVILEILSFQYVSWDFNNWNTCSKFVKTTKIL